MQPIEIAHLDFCFEIRRSSCRFCAVPERNGWGPEELLREIKGFLELRGGRETLLYGTTLITLAGIADDAQEAEQLRAQGMETVDSLRDQTEFD